MSMRLASALITASLVAHPSSALAQGPGDLAKSQSPPGLLAPWVAAGIAFPRHSGETGDVPPGIYVLTPGGELLGRIPIPEDLCTNLAFGGPGRRTLFVTAGKSIYKVPLAVSVYALYPPVGQDKPGR